jgi:hypothetical protein
MRKILLILAVFMSGLCDAEVSLRPRIAGAESKYLKVAANTTDATGGVVIPNGETWTVYRFVANGADPEAYVALIYDYQGGNEKIFASTKGDIDMLFDYTDPGCHITGDGVAKLQVIIINDNASETPIIGGLFEAVKL